MPERREFKRVKCYIPALISFDDSETYQEYLIMDISKGGMFIVSNELIETGKYIHFKLLNQNKVSIISGYGKVVWSNTIEDNEEFSRGFGVFFTELDEIDKEILIQLSEIVNK